MPDGFVIEAAFMRVSPDNSHSCVLVRVKNKNGDPVTGLKKTNFTLLDPEGNESFFFFAEAPAKFLPGTYKLKSAASFAEPVEGGQCGQFGFAVRVKKARSVGQTLVTLVK